MNHNDLIARLLSTDRHVTQPTDKKEAVVAIQSLIAERDMLRMVLYELADCCEIRSDNQYRVWERAAAILAYTKGQTP